MLSNNKSVGAKSETDYSNLDVNPRAKSDSSPLHPNSELTNSNSFGLGTTHVSSSLAANYLNNSNKSNNSVVNNT